MGSIQFFTQDIEFKLSNPRKTRYWIEKVIRKEGHRLGSLNYIFCSDSHLLSLNQQYLKHNTLTDIITFDNREGVNDIEGDIFISIDRVGDNAVKLSSDPDEELHRVIIHGVLHLCGYGDKSATQKSAMRKKEDAYLSLRREA